ALALFFIALILSESLVYTITGRAVSLWSMVLAALAAVLLFSPVVHSLQRMVDRLFFKRHLDTLAAIRALGAGDLADLPVENIETALLERICDICHRAHAALDERVADEGKLFTHPADSPTPLPGGAVSAGYELVLPIECREGAAWLHLGPRTDGWETDEEEIKSLTSLSRFAAMSLEHARLSHMQIQDARLDSLSRMSGQLHSHDLKNRLHDLSFLAHHIGSGKLDAEDTSRLVAAIRKVVGRMQTLMQRMADPQAPIHPMLAPCDVSALLKKSIADRLWPEGLHIHEILPDLPAAAADSAMLQGVFENLFDNGVQAMQKQGDMFIETLLADQMIEVRIRDTGQGISKAFLKQRLFRLFASSKESGLGIGLYLSKRIIETHGGTITAESEGKGKGSTFFVRLPLWQSQQK
ncbi:MAG: ATP-binding protein, partial [Zetaproteobacteria bacterium]|nr:ATP-binding protein [Zetaproteobacteria bacterium]